MLAKLKEISPKMMNVFIEILTDYLGVVLTNPRAVQAVHGEIIQGVLSTCSLLFNWVTFNMIGDHIIPFVELSLKACTLPVVCGNVLDNTLLIQQLVCDCLIALSSKPLLVKHGPTDIRTRSTLWMNSMLQYTDVLFRSMPAE